MTEYKKKENEAALIFEPEVLTTGFWRIEQEMSECTIPLQMSDCIAHFTNFYANKFQSRNLKWLYNYGKLEVQTTFTP